MTAALNLALAAEAREATLLAVGMADQARLMGYVPVPTTTRHILLPKERP
jgi:hypothetical protein